MVTVVTIRMGIERKRCDPESLLRLHGTTVLVLYLEYPYLW